MSPKWKLAETPVMPKSRYEIMAHYMPKVGRHGLDMMFRTCTIQANLDFSDEADMRDKMRVGLALQPIATALFANSPFTEDRPNGFLSYRSEIWRDTDPQPHRHAALRLRRRFRLRALRRLGARRADVFRHARRPLSRHDGRHLPRTSWTASRRTTCRRPRPTMADWKNHLSTLFPEVRLKNYLEMRGADGGPWRRLLALPALWVGLLYEQTSLDGAKALVEDWTAEERQALRDAVPKTALATTFRNRTVLDIARDVVALARDGLKRRGISGNGAADEAPYLHPLEETLALGKTPAENLIWQYQTRWGRSVEPIFEEQAY